VFLDETAAATNMARRYGWAPRGERCRLAAPQGHYKTTTITAALRTSGLCATALLDGPTNGTRFRSYVTDTLIPVLHPGDIVVMDNLPAHKVAGVREAIEAVGARLLYLPSYSPDLNPIEQAFAKLKAKLAQRGSPHDPGSLGGDPTGLHPLHPAGVPQLPRRSRVRGRLGRRYLTGNSSKRPVQYLNPAMPAFRLSAFSYSAST
jgi:transposase